MIDVRAIRQEHIGQGALVLVIAVGLDGDLFPEGEGRGGVLGVVPERLAFLRAVNAAKTDAFSVVAVQDFDGVAVEGGDDGVGGSHTLKRQAAPFVIGTDAVLLRSISLVTVS